LSRNFELLQSEICLGNARAYPKDGVAGEAKNHAQTAAVGLTAAESAAREESLKLVQRLFLTPGQATPKCVLFAGIDVEAGCSSLCAVISRLLAGSVSGSVCLLEGNFRTPTLPKLMGVDNHHGLADALRQEGSIRSFAKRIGTNDLWLLSSGSLVKDSVDLLNSARLKERIGELRSSFEYLVIDAPPLGAYADGLVLSRLADGVVLVLEANETRREAALRITDSLRKSNVPVLGAVLNNRTFPIPAALYKRL
jgi:Mrp family chromosome partitioning ATPase